jgi:ATP-binding cassette, subfamily B, heavy metal transporter
MAASSSPPQGDADFKTLKRFLPYLWPADRSDLKLRVVGALCLVLLAKGVMLAMPYTLKLALDAMSDNLSGGAGVAMALVASYALARFGGVLFDNFRNALFEKVGQEAARHLSLDVFSHIHRLSLRFHLERRTGALTRLIERGTKSIDTMLYFLLFNIFPTVIELTAVCILFGRGFGWELVVATLAMVAAYIVYTQRITDWRANLRREMVTSDQNATARAVDSLLNYETVKYFNAETHENANYGRAIKRYTDAATKSEVSLAWLNIGQSFITNALMAGALVYVVWGWDQGRFTIGDIAFVNGLLMQLFRPLDLLGMVYREIRQGLIDMEAMFRLIDSRAGNRRQARRGRWRCRARGSPSTMCSSPMIRAGRSCTASASTWPGRKLAIVGHSGAGKSTLSRILYRFYDIKAAA